MHLLTWRGQCAPAPACLRCAAERLRLHSMGHKLPLADPALPWKLPCVPTQRGAQDLGEAAGAAGHLGLTH